MLNDFDHAPQDQQYGPVAGEQVSQLADRQNAHGAQQEHEANDDQHQWAGKGTVTRRRQWRQRRELRTWWSCDWVRHSSPPRRKDRWPATEAPADFVPSPDTPLAHRELADTWGDSPQDLAASGRCALHRTHCSAIV